jgi:hypothetical protein
LELQREGYGLLRDGSCLEEGLKRMYHIYFGHC